MENNITVEKVTFDVVDKSFVEKLASAFPVVEENPEWKLEELQKFITNNHNLLLIGYLNGEMAGYLYGHILDRFDEKKQFFIYELSTSGTHRRKGVMRTVIASLLDMLRSDGYEEAWVLTNKSNIPAMSLYESTGGKQENNDDVMFVYDLHVG